MDTASRGELEVHVRFANLSGSLIESNAVHWEDRGRSTNSIGEVLTVECSRAEAMENDPAKIDERSHCVS